MPRSYALGDHFEDFIDSQVKTGRFNNASEVVRAGLRLLEDQEKPAALSLDDLKRLLQEGAGSGPGKPAHDVLDRLENKYRRLSKKGVKAS
ncbi:MAG: type II toxin-antitoxin system ParD family antitoxin [Rhodospirillales bacterium]|jgi:antitoxin ParD1/3/4